VPNGSNHDSSEQQESPEAFDGCDSLRSSPFGLRSLLRLTRRTPRPFQSRPISLSRLGGTERGRSLAPSRAKQAPTEAWFERAELSRHPENLRFSETASLGWASAGRLRLPSSRRAAPWTTGGFLAVHSGHHSIHPSIRRGLAVRRCDNTRWRTRVL